MQGFKNLVIDSLQEKIGKKYFCINSILPKALKCNKPHLLQTPLNQNYGHCNLSISYGTKHQGKIATMGKELIAQD